uniref:Uncharacterized protein n=1 Tax=viral metagenome TaxID=1070528 RepID=A0A6H1ZPP6_9ZZZZ
MTTDEINAWKILKEKKRSSNKEYGLKPTLSALEIFEDRKKNKKLTEFWGD